MAIPALSRQYNKVCDLPDFDDPTLRAMLRDIVGPGYEPATEVRRKFWEYALLGRYLEEVGVLNDDVQVLAVAAGHEEPLYWLANRVGRMVATDIYGEGGFSVEGREADGSMLDDPSRWAPYEYRKDHLEVQSMNALALDFPDDSFDVVYSLSSIEHFGGSPEVQQAAREMARVLKPGGHLIVVTECFVKNHPLDWPLLQTAIRAATLGRRCPCATPRRRMIDGFRPRELQRDVIKPTGLQLAQPMDWSVSPQTFDNTIHWTEDGTLRPQTGEEYPHIMLKAQGSPWTSAFVALHGAA